jgi:hypothetical protein
MFWSRKFGWSKIRSRKVWYSRVRLAAGRLGGVRIVIGLLGVESLGERWLGGMRNRMVWWAEVWRKMVGCSEVRSRMDVE